MACHSTILLFHHSNPMRLVSNKANSPGGARRDAVPGRGAGFRCTNKPNLACPGTRRGVALNKQSQTWASRGIRGTGDRAGQFCQTKPILRLRIGDRVATGRPLGPAGPGAGCTNKSNWATLARASLQLRSQGRLCPWIRIMGGTPCYYMPIRRSAFPGGQSRQTKPIGAAAV
jgi:hypothetical protein